MDNRKKPQWFHILVIVSVNALLLASAYWGFLYFTEKYIDKRRNSTLVYDINSLRRQHLLPNQTYTRGTVSYSINSLGMRGTPPSAQPAPNTVRLFVMGGSSVFDHRNSTSWPEQLGGILSANSPFPVKAFNAGIPGYSSRESLAFYHDAIRYLSPDIVLIYQGWNDVKYMRRFEKGVNTIRHYSVKSWRGKYKFLTAPQPVRNWEALKMMIQEFLESTDALREGATLSPLFEPLSSTAWAQSAPSGVDNTLREHWAGTPGMHFYRNNIHALVQAVKLDGALPVLVAQNTLATPDLASDLRTKIAYKYIRMDHENLVAVNEAMVDVLKQISQEEHIPFIELRPHFNGAPHYFHDHVHMTKLGSQSFAKALGQELMPLVQDSSIRTE